MTPQTRFADGTQTLFIGNAIFVPYVKHHVSEKDAREIIFRALEADDLKSAEEIAQEVGIAISKAKRALFDMGSTDCGWRVFKVWQKVKGRRGRCVYTTRESLADPEPLTLVMSIMSDGVARSLKAVIK